MATILTTNRHVDRLHRLALGGIAALALLAAFAALRPSPAAAAEPEFTVKVTFETINFTGIDDGDNSVAEVYASYVGEGSSDSDGVRNIGTWGESPDSCSEQPWWANFDFECPKIVV